jgi:hypothetical protein
VSGGFATVQPGNLLSINAVEAYALEDFAPEAVRAGLAEAHRVANGSGSEEEIAEAKIELEVYEALQVRLCGRTPTNSSRRRVLNKSTYRRISKLIPTVDVCDCVLRVNDPFSMS